MWVFRSHKIEAPFPQSYEKVRDYYFDRMEEGVLLTQSEMEEILDKNMGTRTEEATFSFQVEEPMARASAVQDSMDDYYNNMKAGEAVKCIGKRTRQRIRCSICMSSKRTKIKLRCGHCFHRKCIDRWASWKAVCPTCNEKLRLRAPRTPPLPPPPPTTPPDTADNSDSFSSI